MVYDTDTETLLLFGGSDGESGLNDTWAYDPAAGEWTDLLPVGDLPSERDGHAMVYDPGRNQVVMFGGWDERRNRDLADTWVYDPDANAWTEIHPTGARPTARDGHVMVYDPAGDQAILFGGVDGVGSFLNDTWAYDPAAEEWTELDPAGAVPPARGYSAMVYDPAGKRFVLFGGAAEDGYYNDTWAYDPAAGAWTELKPIGDLPGRRSSHLMVYDLANHTVLLYGGGTDQAGYWETWAYDPAANTWTDLDPPGGVPQVDRGHAMVYYPARGTMILFGGWGWEEVSNATWVYDPSGQSGGSPGLYATGPAPRGYHGLFYDPVGGRVVLFGGGTDTTDYGDTWSYDATVNKWTELAPKGEQPEARSWPALAYDAAGRKALLFGGATMVGALNDTWTYDPALNSWAEVEPMGERPPERWLGVTVYDSAHGMLILFGGAGVEGMLNDTWTYDTATGGWTARDPVGSLPSPRGFHSLAYDARSGRVVLFGGMNDYEEDLGDMWSYDPVKNSWTEIDSAGPAPTARSGHAMVYDSLNGRMILFGGATSMEGFNDTWAYDPAAGTWTDLKPTGDLPSDRAYHAMVYDRGTDRVILFGGFDGAQYVNDVWEYDPVRNVWTELMAVTGETTQAWQSGWMLAAMTEGSGP
jgi:N-acetylneuraminic acid mutarotase